LRLEDIVSKPGFPQSFIGKDVVFGKIAGTFKRFASGEQKLIISDAASEGDRQISVKMFPILKMERPVMARPNSRNPEKVPQIKKSPSESPYKWALTSQFPGNCIGKVVDYLDRTTSWRDAPRGWIPARAGAPKGRSITPVSIEHLKRAAKQRQAPA
jgi:hypothetical protein